MSTPDPSGGELHAELALAIDLAYRAGALALQLQSTGLSVQHKAGDEPVTEADMRASTLIVEALTAAYPGDAVLSEEGADDRSRLTKPRVWMIDPIDGTRDFIKGGDGYATMIGLLIGSQPALGVVYQPMGDRMYQAVRQYGSFFTAGFSTGGERRRCHASTVARSVDLRMVASKSQREEIITEVRKSLGISDELNVGSVGLKLGLIARGERDLYVNPKGRSKRWDTLAPQVILEEGGGRITDAHGRPIDYRAEELSNLHGLIASNGPLHDEIVERIRPLMRV